MSDSKEQSLFTSMKALSHSKGIPIAQLKAAKSMNADGFNTNNSINWIKFAPWYEANKDKLVKSEENTYSFYKTLKVKNETLIQAETLKKIRRESIDPQDVKDFLNKVSVKQSHVFKSSIRDLISKYPHVKPELDQLVQSVCSIFQDEQAKWIQ